MDTVLPAVIDPLTLSRAITETFYNTRVTRVNHEEIRMSVMTEAFPWHRHPDSDETFLVVDGELIVEFEKGEVVLKPGQMLTVRRGLLHRTRPAGQRSVNLTFEKMGTDTIYE